MRRNIYIRDEDSALFEKAEALGGDNFSAMIAEAVRRFVEAEEAKADGHEEQEVEVGMYSSTGSDDIKKVKFLGKKIAGASILHGQSSSRDAKGTDYKLYLTKKGKFLLHQEYWTRWQGEDGEASYKVYESMSQLMSAEGVPGGLLEEAGQRLEIDIAEYLDV